MSSGYAGHFGGAQRLAGRRTIVIGSDGPEQGARHVSHQLDLVEGAGLDPARGCRAQLALWKSKSADDSSSADAFRRWRSRDREAIGRKTIVRAFSSKDCITITFSMSRLRLEVTLGVGEKRNIKCSKPPLTPKTCPVMYPEESQPEVHHSGRPPTVGPADPGMLPLIRFQDLSGIDSTI